MKNIPQSQIETQLFVDRSPYSEWRYVPPVLLVIAGMLLLLLMLVGLFVLPSMEIHGERGELRPGGLLRLITTLGGMGSTALVFFFAAFAFIKGWYGYAYGALALVFLGYVLVAATVPV